MKKKRLQFILVSMVAYLLTFGGALSANAQQLGDPIEFSVEWGYPSPIDPGFGKGPVLMPTVWQSH